MQKSLEDETIIIVYYRQEVKVKETKKLFDRVSGDLDRWVQGLYQPLILLNLNKTANNTGLVRSLKSREVLELIVLEFPSLSNNKYVNVVL